MLDIQTLNQKVVHHFFTTLYQNVAKDLELTILQDRQSSPRPLDTQGNLKTYLFYRVEAPYTPQWQTLQILEENGVMLERTRTQRTLTVVVNCLGQNAATVAAYFDHAINSNLAYNALRTTIDDKVYQFQYNAHTEPIDLTEIELTKWVARVSFEVTLGYVDVEDFVVDVFDTVEVTETVEAAGVPAKPIIIKNKEV